MFQLGYAAGGGTIAVVPAHMRCPDITETLEFADALGSARYLDRHGRVGWRDRMNVATLQIQSTSCCALAQEYGDYMTGLRRSGLSEVDQGDPRRRGFMVCKGRSGRRLNHAWVYIILNDIR